MNKMIIHLVSAFLSITKLETLNKFLHYICWKNLYNLLLSLYKEMNWRGSAKMEESATFTPLILVELPYFILSSLMPKYSTLDLFLWQLRALLPKTIFWNIYFAWKGRKFKDIFLSIKALLSTDNSSWWTTHGSEKWRLTPCRAGLRTITQSTVKWSWPSKIVMIDPRLRHWVPGREGGWRPAQEGHD